MNLLRRIRRLFTPERFQSIEWLDPYKAIIHTNKTSYRGGCTVWHNAHTGRRIGTFGEGWLCDIWTREKWRCEDERAKRAENWKPDPGKYLIDQISKSADAT